MFRTELEPSLSEFKISHDSDIISFGSCFADTIGNKLLDSKFNTNVNPFGIIYNPASIFDLLTDILNDDVDIDNSLILNNSIWHSFLIHSKHSKMDKEELVGFFKFIIVSLKAQLESTNTIIFTLGSAYAYLHRDKNILVANCHKVPSKEFEKKLLTIEEIVSSFDRFQGALAKVNNGFSNIIFTVSPVRHIRDGLENNNISKSTLRMAIDNIILKYNNAHYFPSFEILIDDLRDYRYYKDDLLHPTSFAEEYVWQKFKNTFFENSTKQKVDEVMKINNAVNHRPFNISSDKHQDFLKKLLHKMEVIELDYSNETEQIKSQLL